MSPAPGLRNKGQSVVEQIADKSRIDFISDTRSRLVAHRARQATGWEAAAGTLESRARQVRTEHERAHHLELYSQDVRRGRATGRHEVTTTLPVQAAALEPRYWLGACLRCEREIWAHTLRPRVPVCQRCRGQQ